MIRVKAVIEYDGTAYRGWQRQPDAATVQGVCESALAGVLERATGIVAAGRTDTGVHARGQVVHFDHPGRLRPDELRRAWNARLPPDVWVRSAEAAPPGFHARYGAAARTYRYCVADGPRARSPFGVRYRWPLDRRPDWERVEEATRSIVGERDFRRFAKGVPPPGSGGGGRCDVAAARWRPIAGGRMLEITADRFLRHMVRAIVGALVSVGWERTTVEAIEAALDGHGRVPAPYAPPNGLFLWRVDYR